MQIQIFCFRCCSIRCTYFYLRLFIRFQCIFRNCCYLIRILLQILYITNHVSDVQVICLNKIVSSFRLWACRILLNKQPSSCQRDLSEPKKNYINIRNISHCENNWYNRHPALLTGSRRITNKIGYDTFIIPEKTIFLCNVHSPGVYCVLVSIDTRFIYLDDCSLRVFCWLRNYRSEKWGFNQVHIQLR